MAAVAFAHTTVHVDVYDGNLHGRGYHQNEGTDHHSNFLSTSTEAEQGIQQTNETMHPSNGSLWKDLKKTFRKYKEFVEEGRQKVIAKELEREEKIKRELTDNNTLAQGVKENLDKLYKKEKKKEIEDEMGIREGKENSKENGTVQEGKTIQKGEDNETNTSEIEESNKEKVSKGQMQDHNETKNTTLQPSDQSVGNTRNSNEES